MEKTANDCNFQNCETINCTRRTLPAVSVASALMPKQLEAAELVIIILGKREKIVCKGSEVEPKALDIGT